MKGNFGFCQRAERAPRRAEVGVSMRSAREMLSEATTRAARGQAFRSKKVRAKDNISPPNVTSACVSKPDTRAAGAGEGRKARRFATNSEGAGAPKRADLSLFRI